MKITSTDFSKFVKEFDGQTNCKTGDYSLLKRLKQQCVFEDGCIFGDNTKFAMYSDFGDNCTFGNNCEFDANLKFGNNCSFGLTNKFSTGMRFGNECSFALSDMCQSLQFGQLMEFGNNCKFGEFVCKTNKPFIAQMGISAYTTFIFNTIEGLKITVGGYKLRSLEEFKNKLLIDDSEQEQMATLLYMNLFKSAEIMFKD